MLHRTVVLVAADGAVFFGARALVRSLRVSVVGVDVIAPPGLLAGAQAALALILGLLVVGAYQEGDRWRSWGRVWQGVCLGTGVVLWDDLFLADPGATLVRWALISSLVALSLGASRTAISLTLAFRRRKDPRRERVLMVVPEDDAAFVDRGRLFSLAGPFEIAERLVLSDRDEAGGFTERMLNAVTATQVGTVIVAGYVTQDVWSRVVELSDLAGCRLLSLSGHGGPLVTAVRQVSYLGIPLTEVTAPHLRFHQLILKRTFDLALAGLSLLFLSPLLLLVAGAVRLSGPGPILFKQERVGLGGRRFNILKFRSMTVGAEQMLDDVWGQNVYSDPRLFKIKDDPRVTGLGRFLRSWSLDELPQLINVLSGEMSLVGPRPPIPREVVLYGAHDYARFDVKPGITGPWQVSGRNEVTDFQEVVLLEREYIRNWNIGKDLRIMFETIPVVLFRRGAF